MQNRSRSSTSGRSLGLPLEHHDLDAPVLAAARVRRVIGDGLVRSVPLGDEAPLFDTTLDHRGEHRGGAALREALIELRSALVVGVTANFELDACRSGVDVLD